MSAEAQAGLTRSSEARGSPVPELKGAESMEEGHSGTLESPVSSCSPPLSNHRAATLVLPGTPGSRSI